MSQLIHQQVSPQQLEDRLVLLGATAPSLKDIINSAAVSSENPGLVSGVEVQAHAISQILRPWRSRFQVQTYQTGRSATAEFRENMFLVFDGFSSLMKTFRCEIYRAIPQMQCCAD